MPKKAAFHFTLAAVLTSAWTVGTIHSTSVWNGGILSDKERSGQAECHLSSRSNQFNKGQGQHCNQCSEENTEFITNNPGEVAPTSVWCHVAGESGLRCYFHNLYYNSRHKEFVFVLSGDSLINGVDSLKVLEKLYLSSANGHNAFQIKLSVLPGKEANIARGAVKYTGKTLILGRFKPDNIHHVFHDDLLPIYFTIREFCVDMNSCKDTLKIIFTDENERGIFWELYHIFTKNIMKLQDLDNKNEWYCFQETYIGLNKMSVWYQYGFGVSQGPIENNFQGTHLRQFTSFVREKLGVKNQLVKQNGILLSRKLNRKIVNERELFDAIQGLLSSTRDCEDITMKTVTLEEGNLKSVISEFSEAVLVIGVHGSALILGMFLPPGSVMVELWPYGIDPSAAPVFKTMCELDGFDVIYIPWTNEDLHSTVYHSNYASYYGGLEELPKEDQDKVIKSLSAEKLTGLECCDSTEWLFRIYQDTNVNVRNDANFVSVNILELIADGLRRRELIITKTGYKDEYFKESKYPGKVRTLRCYMGREETSTKIYIKWVEPWNVEYLKCKELDFEVVIQSKGKVELKKYRTRESTFLKKLAYSIEKMDVWVTCICDGFESPTSYVVCL
ncbi:protein O-linked-mannose beta-1,4-N-acetylglucosaminyltransferase 2-like [Palaemon carinicauda]|uniref:protein O-linked-mannose beta-1,4-N-acetylglucosaminyltransferase 2-like n=1 Tax=Palaemon carinicauda TaxID=392227 RepID=UPI0035B67B77